MEADEQNELRRQVARLEARVERLERAAANSSVAATAKPFSTPRSFTPPAKPSLESRIGAQIFNRVGIFAVLVGVALFLKYAVDQRWLGPGARVLIGLGAGIGLIAWSERFRTKGFPVFSFSLKAAGTGVLYLALWAGFALFHLVPFAVALGAMALVTAGNAWLCWAQRSQVLAAYALTGGFLTPTLLEAGHTAVPVLGAYLLILNAGIVALLVMRRWPRLLPAAFAGTICYLLVWGFHASELRVQGQTGEALALALMFFLGFSICPLFLDAERTPWGSWIAGTTAVANAGLGTLPIYLLLLRPSFAAQWLLCGAAAWFGLLLIPGRTRRGFPPVHAALVIALAAAGMWVALERGGLILGWILETATLLWIAGRRPETAGQVERAYAQDYPVMQSPVAPGLLLLGTGALLIAESAMHMLGSAQHVFVNERFALFLAAVGVCIAGVRVSARQHAPKLEQGTAVGPAMQAAWGRMGAGCSVLATVLLLAAGIFETRTYWGDPGLLWGGTATVAERFAVSAWAGVLGLGLLIAGFRVRWAFLRWQALALLTLAIGKVFLLDARVLTQGFRILSALGLGVLLLAVSFIYQRDLLNLRGKEHDE
jgi:uncharacterized membrane protein